MRPLPVIARTAIALGVAVALVGAPPAASASPPTTGYTVTIGSTSS